MDLKEVLKGGIIGLVIGIIGVFIILSIMGDNSRSMKTLFMIVIPILSFLAGAARAIKKK
jgi:hypothetical protein